LARLKKKCQDLANDTAKFQSYIDQRVKKNAKYETLNARVKEDVARLNQQLSKLEAEKAQIRIKIREKNVPEQELVAAYEKHSQIQTDYANKAAALEEAKRDLKEKNDKLIQLKQQVKKCILYLYVGWFDLIFYIAW
jgi:chromosome segregation ATPase